MISDSLGLSYVWMQQAEIDIPLNLIKQRLFGAYYQTWYSDINISNRLHTYARFNHEFQRKEYLNFIIKSKYRISLRRCRLSSHNLHIECGRHENVPGHDRLCRYCNMNVVEDEHHFLLVCPLYMTLRQKYFKPYYYHWPNINKSDNSSKQTTAKLAKFIYNAT